jgi:hypothetical protein
MNFLEDALCAWTLFRGGMGNDNAPVDAADDGAT